MEMDRQGAAGGRLGRRHDDDAVSVSDHGVAAFQDPLEAETFQQFTLAIQAQAIFRDAALGGAQKAAIQS